MPLPSARPGDAPPRVNIADFKSDVLLLGISGIHRNIQTANGIADAVRCFIVPILGSQSGVYFTDVMVFSTRVVGRLRDIAPGTMVSGLVTQGDGRNAPADFEPLSAEWQAYADSKIVEWDAELTHAMRQATEDFHKWEANRKDKPTGGQLPTSMPPVPSGPTVPNPPPATSSAPAPSSATTPVPAPNGPPTSNPAAGTPMPPVPGTEGAASPAEAGF